MLQFLLVSALVLLTRAKARASVIFEDCGSAYGLEVVNIEGCGLSLPCYVTLGENVTVKVEFYADSMPFRLDQDVVINLNYINLQTPVSPDPCEVTDCPVSIVSLTSLTSVISVPRNIALNQRGWLRWRVFNEAEKLVLCFSVLVQTQNRLQRLIRQHLEGRPTEASNVEMDDFDGNIDAEEVLEHLILEMGTENIGLNQNDHDIGFNERVADVKNY